MIHNDIIFPFEALLRTNIGAGHISFEVEEVTFHVVAGMEEKEQNRNDHGSKE